VIFFERKYRSSRIGSEIIVCRAAPIMQERYYMPLTETRPCKKNSGTGLLRTDSGVKTRTFPPPRPRCPPGSVLLTRGAFRSFGCPVQAGMVQTYPPMICVILAGTTVFFFSKPVRGKPVFYAGKREKREKKYWLGRRQMQFSPKAQAAGSRENDTGVSRVGLRSGSRSQKDFVTL